MRLRLFVLVWVGIFLLSFPAAAQEPDAPLQDPFLDDMVGTWTMTGHVMGDSVEYDATGTWVLNHQFLRLRMEDVNTPPEYVARVFIGYDGKNKEYVAHWLDSSGGRSSKTLGYGQLEDNAIEFRFDYPEGPFRTTFEQIGDNTWHIRMRSKGDNGSWSAFADFEMVPRSSP